MTNDKYGPQTYQIEKVLKRIKTLTPDEIEKLKATRRDARRITWSEAWDAAWYVVLALSVRHLITPDGFDLLAEPWREVIGEFEEPPVSITIELTEEQPKENKENMIALRLNNEQMLAVRQWANAHQVNVSAVIRSAIEHMTGAKQ